MHDDNRPPRPQVTLHQGRARPASATLRSPTHIALKALAARYQDLDDKVGELDVAIGAILEEKCVSSQGSEQRDTHRCARKAEDGRQDSRLGGPQDV